MYAAMFESRGSLLGRIHYYHGRTGYIVDEYLKYSFYPYDLVSFSSVFMLNKCPNTLKVHTYDQVIHLVEL